MDNQELKKMFTETAFNLKQMGLEAKRGGYYEADGKKWSRVTKVLEVLDKPALKQWAANMTAECLKTSWLKGNLTEGDFELAKKNYWQQSQRAMKIGTEIHKMIERHIKEGLELAPLIVDAREEIRNAVNAFIDWEERYIDTWLISECPVWSDELNSAGMLDEFAIMKEPLDGKKYIIDVKVSTGIYDEAYLQTAAYALMWQELIEQDMIPKELTIDGTMVLCLNKITGMPKWKDATPFLAESQEAFARLANFYQAQLAFNNVKPDWREGR